MYNHNIFCENSMTNHKILSETEEMYLVTIRIICEHCTDSPIPIPAIADRLGVQPVSANQMVNKLAETGLVKYIPYKGVELTAKGQAISSRILRHRRLWEVFLVKILKMDLDQANQLACQFEHVTSPDVANRLSAFLDHPIVDFYGDPIPQMGDEQNISFEGVPLSNLQIGETAPVINIDADATTIKFLSAEGILPGIRVHLLAVGNNGDLLLQAQNSHVHLSAEMAPAILIGSPDQPKNFKKEEHLMSIPLSNLKVGESGIIQKMNFKGAIRQRLLAMGLVVGETILVKRVAPLGDPIDFIVKGYDLSLRKAEANEIFVSALQES